MEAREVLKQYFGFESYNPGQEEVIEAILSGRDVLAIMPTGSGKSICYQVPALCMPGVTIVISPLISLMQDQVKELNATGIHAGYINSSLSESQIYQVYSRALAGAYKILYVAPERLESYDFLEFTGQLDISMVTVDEAHCISQWGQDFRPSYLKIVDFIDGLKKRPVVGAFTATATNEVKTDISCVLKLNDPLVMMTGFDRENLYFEVEMPKKKDDYVLDYINNHPNESGIIYCATRKSVDSLQEFLLKKGINVAKYHAGMSNKERIDNQNDFIYDRLPIIVATNAFGMGINKSNVRYVIHYNMPQSMENYYQEAGRAGRDGEAANCILLFAVQDIMINRFLLEHKDFTDVLPEDVELIRQRDIKRLRVMEGYCRSAECLRKNILEYFGEKRDKPCDNCGNCRNSINRVDMTDDAKQVINCVYEAKGRYGMNIIIGTLRGANRARLKELNTISYKTYGVLKERSEADIRLLINQMLMDGYIIQTDEPYSVIRMGEIKPLKNPDMHVMVRLYKEKDPDKEIKKSFAKKTDELTRAGYNLFEVLRQLRLTIAKEEAMPPYIIFSDKTLIEMSIKIPRDKEHMMRISGVGNRKYDKYGERFIEAISTYLDSNPGMVTSISVEETDDSQGGKEKNGSKRVEYNRKMNKPDGAGAAWTLEEDNKLDEEFLSGIPIGQIAEMHDRTRGGIRARLKKHGLIDF
ncbi:MAG: DNA helicase RecQ [Lachnospiraceae bacterium]|nr:DNA helicase RecQ [Lachnospiraceae bacterium]